MAIELTDQLVREGMDLRHELLLRAANHRRSRNAPTAAQRRYAEMSVALGLWGEFLRARETRQRGADHASLG